jgi:Uncharacterised nucleotidyltransferase
VPPLKLQTPSIFGCAADADAVIVAMAITRVAIPRRISVLPFHEGRDIRLFTLRDDRARHHRTAVHCQSGRSRRHLGRIFTSLSTSGVRSSPAANPNLRKTATVPLPSELLKQAMWSLAVDKLTAEAVEEFESRGIEVLLVKGPVIARWLYPREVRRYGDSDLVVAPENWDDAVALLEEMGFRDYLAALEHPRIKSRAGTGFRRGAENIDLHSTLPGLRADPQEVWQTLWAAAQTQEVGGRVVLVPDRAGVLMHLALHAAHHVEGRPLEDLARAVDTATQQEWRGAVDLAARLGGLEAFASGLRLVPQAAGVAERLGLAWTGSVEFDLRHARVPLAEGLNDLMTAPLADRPGIIARELFPNAAFMRWAMPIARRGPAGLIVSYPARWFSMFWQLPVAVLTVYRTRRRRR